MNQSIFEQALSAFAQNFTFLCILVVAVLGLVGLFNLLQHNNGLRAAGDAAGRRDTREDARIARSVTSADWATSFTEKPEWATQGKVGFNRSASADGTHRGSSSGSYSFGDTPTPPPAGT
jgi:Flp pilus assembly protein TadG